MSSFSNEIRLVDTETLLDMLNDEKYLSDPVNDDDYAAHANNVRAIKAELKRRNRVPVKNWY